MKRFITISALAMFILLSPKIGWANDKVVARYEIDAKRLGTSPTDQDGLPRGREFIRLDSTYYVGWMFGALFLYDRSVDEDGYRQALPYARKAFQLLNREFGSDLKTIFDNTALYFEKNQLFNDYIQVAKTLKDCYEYLEFPDSAYAVLDSVENKQFQRDFLGTSYGKAWLIHRNRTNTNLQYSFLGNSVAENEQMALQACYRGLELIRNHQKINDAWFGEYHSEIDRQLVNHYLALIHSYVGNYDSSRYYYEQMEAAGMVSYNNFANLEAETGHFATALQYYAKEPIRYGEQKMLMEPYYYMPMLFLYGGQTQKAISMASEAIQASNSSPGFGWYHIALARAYLYHGRLDSAQYILNKASMFKEIHIGTTLTEPQYRFTIDVLQNTIYKNQLAFLKFSDRRWWLSPKKIWSYAVLWAKKYLLEYKLVSDLKENPERDRIVYELFCGESTLSFDEATSLMQLNGGDYFFKKLNHLAASDTREKIKPFFYYAMQACQPTQQTNAQVLSQLLVPGQIDSGGQNLLFAKVNQLLWQRQDLQKANTISYQKQVFQQFPQLIPFGKTRPQVSIQFSGFNTPFLKNVKEALLQSQLDLVPPNQAAILINLKAAQQQSRYQISIETSVSGSSITQKTNFIANPFNGLAAEILLRIFGTSGPKKMEE